MSLIDRFRTRHGRGDRDDRGATLVEYTLLAGAFALVVVGGISSLQGEFETAYDDRQPQYGAPHATNQTTTTAPVGSTTTTLPTSSSTSSTSTTSTTTAPTTTSTTAPPVNLTYWWHAPHFTSGSRWAVTTQMFLFRSNGQPYANSTVVVSYFDINQFPIGSATGTTNALGYLSLTSPQFRKQDHKRVFVAVTSVNGNTGWESSLSGWVNQP